MEALGEHFRYIFGAFSALGAGSRAGRAQGPDGHRPSSRLRTQGTFLGPKRYSLCIVFKGNILGAQVMFLGVQITRAFLYLRSLHLFIIWRFCISVVWENKVLRSFLQVTSLLAAFMSTLDSQLSYGSSVRTRPGRLDDLSVLHSDFVWRGCFVVVLWSAGAQRALSAAFGAGSMSSTTCTSRTSRRARVTSTMSPRPALQCLASPWRP